MVRTEKIKTIIIMVLGAIILVWGAMSFATYKLHKAEFKYEQVVEENVELKEYIKIVTWPDNVKEQLKNRYGIEFPEKQVAPSE